MSTETYLVKTEAARRAIEAARSVDEVKSIRDQAEAARLYAKQARLGIEMVNAANEIKLRAERRAGEILAEMDKNPGVATPSTPVRASAPKLADLGITHNQSSQWQQMAKIPASQFEQHIAERKAAGEELSAAGVLRILDETTDPDELPANAPVTVIVHHKHVCKDCGLIFHD